jgi:hypothetical protein
MRTTQRQRRIVGRATLVMLKPFFRHSPSREAYVLRVVGNRVGPVLMTKEAFDLRATYKRLADERGRS